MSSVKLMEDLSTVVNFTENTLSTSFEITINTGNYENIKVSVGRGAKWEGNLSKEDSDALLKELYLDCVEASIKEGNFALKQFNRMAATGFPKILGKRPDKTSDRIDMEDVEAEEM